MRMETPQIRRYRDTLIIVGTGILVLGVWSIAKFLLQISLFKDYLAQFGISEIAICILLVLYVIDIVIRAYIYKCARAESRGIQKGSLFLFFAGLVAFSHLVSIAESIALLVVNDSTSILETIATVIVDFTCFCMTVEFIMSAFRLRELERQGGENHET